MKKWLFWISLPLLWGLNLAACHKNRAGKDQTPKSPDVREGMSEAREAGEGADTLSKDALYREKNNTPVKESPKHDAPEQKEIDEQKKQKRKQ